MKQSIKITKALEKMEKFTKYIDGKNEYNARRCLDKPPEKMEIRYIVVNV